MFRKIEFEKSAQMEHAQILRHWHWFKTQLEQIQAIQHLPDAFTEDEGQVEVLDRVSEDDPRYDFVAAEYNYQSRTQKLHFVQELCIVEVHISKTDIGDYFRFQVDTAAGPTEQVKFVGTHQGCRLELDDTSPYFPAWDVAAQSHRWEIT